MSDEGDKGAPPTQETIQDQPVENPSPSNSPTQKLAPRKLTIDDFIVVKCLGKGHFGEVVLAKGKADKKKYAIKMLSKEFMEKTNCQKNAISEREFLSFLKCRQIPQLYSCFQDSRHLYYVMEYCSGGTLSDYLTSQKTLPLAEVKKITAELVMILEALNVHGVCHRDIKPHNLVFDAEGHLKLVDFGIAKLFEKTEKNSSHFDRIKKVLMEYEKKSLTNQKLEQFDDNEGNTTDTEPKDLVGSELYAAPEMIINGYSDFETDYWAMVYFMIFGSYPFEPNSGSQMNLFKKICSGDIPLPQLDPPLEESAADFLKKLLKRDPKKRLGCGKKVGDQESNNGFDKLKFHPFLKDIDYDKLYLEKGPKVLKNIGATTMTPEVSVQSSTVNSSLSTSQANSTLQSKKTELICKVETKRKKFLFIDVVGHLLLFSDHTIRYDQVYDNSSRLFKFKKIKIEFNPKTQGIFIEAKQTNKTYDLKVTNGQEAFDTFYSCYNEEKKEFSKKNSSGEA